MACKNHSDEKATTKRNLLTKHLTTDSSYNSCLKNLEAFADTVKVIPKWYYTFKNEKKFSLDQCDVVRLRDDTVFKTSVIKIMLKIYLEDLKTDAYADDLLAMTSITPTANKILQEYIYIIYGKYETTSEVEMLPSRSVRFIKDDVFKKDRDIMTLLNACEKERLRRKSKHQYDFLN